VIRQALDWRRAKLDHFAKSDRGYWTNHKTFRANARVCRQTVGQEFKKQKEARPVKVWPQKITPGWQGLKNYLL
jgi:hypothetical protein